MAQKKTLKGVKNTPESSDFTYKSKNFCIVKFNPKTIVNLALDSELNEATIKVTDTVSGKVYTGTVELQEVE